MAGFDKARLQRILLGLGVLVVVGLLTAEELGFLSEDLPDVGRSAPSVLAPPPGLVLQATIPASGTAPAMAILADGTAPPVLVPEGANFKPDLRVERVLDGRIVLRSKGLDAPMILSVGAAPSSAPAAVPAPAAPPNAR